jgi:hypothetical protein
LVGVRSEPWTGRRPKRAAVVRFNLSEEQRGRLVISRSRVALMSAPPIPNPRFGSMIYPTPSVGCGFGHSGLVDCAVWPFSLDGPLVVASNIPSAAASLAPQPKGPRSAVPTVGLGAGGDDRDRCLSREGERLIPIVPQPSITLASQIRN